MKKILKEPLVQFLTIGALLFFVYGLINTEELRNEIVVDTNLINEFVAKWELKRNRQPSLQELKGLVNQYIEREVLYREALAMNLDHNDEIVKRRLAQKMEFISDALAETLQPTEEMLVTYYEEHKENYIKSPIYTMQQVYFSEDKRGNVFEDVKSALKSENPEDLGDNISLSSQYTSVSALKIARDYGSAFATALDSLPIGEWTGPIYSGFGVHIIFISEKKPAGYFTFNEVAEKVNVDYNYEASNDFRKELIASLLKNYTININLDDSELKKELNEKY
ncbi:MAG: peptidyl-prolyl cis-trans isomerase [Bacteroidetes bacterium]|nr:peptidyl-prolyl cis-trans isomerase [Bacteroidota bacterium]